MWRPLYITPLVAVLLWAGTASAQTLNDPTRPPRMTTAEGEKAQARAPVLQSVMITPTHRSAIIDGERVELGARFGDARVSKITETEVVLAAKGRTEVLKMYPNVDKAGRDKDQLRDTPTALRPRAKARH